MGTLRIRFTGLCLLKHDSRDGHIDVRFVADPGEHQHSGHHAPHSPLLCIPYGSWISSSVAGTDFPKRDAGRPHHLFKYTKVHLKEAGAATAGRVTLFEHPALPTIPETENDWKDCRFLLHTSRTFPNGVFDQGHADKVAAAGRVELRGGTLFGGVPQTKLGERSWRFPDTSEAYITDIAVYEYAPRETRMTVVLSAGPTADDKEIELDLTSDVDCWIVHDPFGSPLAQHQRTVVREHRKIRHLEQLSDLYPGHDGIPEIISSFGANPDTPTCPPLLDR